MAALRRLGTRRGRRDRRRRACVAATIAGRWFVARRGLVVGLLTAANSTGQLIFLPVMAWLTETTDWRWVALAGSF